MKKKTIGIIIAVIVGVVVVAAALIVFGIYADFRDTNAQMAAGRKFMDSLTDADFPVWIERSQKLVSQGDGLIMSTDNRMPDELKQMKLLGIDVGTDYVTYIWMGSIDHTNLQVKRTKAGTFEITATYNDMESKVLWPKEVVTQ